MADNKEFIQKAMDILGEVSAQRKQEKAQIEKDRQNLIAAIGKDLSSIIAPILKELSNQSRISRQELSGALKEAVSDLVINVQAPEVNVNVPDVRVAAPSVTVNPPIVNVPPIKVPEAIINMPDFINAKLSGVSSKYPLPVILTNERGEPYSAGSIMSGGGGGVNAFKQGVVLIRDFVSSTGASMIDPDGRLKTSGATSITDSVEVKQVSGFIDSVSIKSSDVSFEVKQVSGFVDSVSVVAQDFTFDVKQVSGSSNSINVVSQDVVLDVRQVSGATDSVAVKSVDVSLEVKQVSGFNDSVFVTGASGTIMVVGDIASDVADTDTAPIKIGGIARTANPAAVAAGDRVSASYDTIGRQLMRPLQVRGLLTTAYATLSTNTETTLLASGAGVFNDLLYIAFANTSAGAVDIDLRDATAGGIVATFTAPADATTGVSLSVPVPQNVAADTWTVDFNTADVSGTTVYVNALFSKEV